MYTEISQNFNRYFKALWVILILDNALYKNYVIMIIIIYQLGQEKYLHLDTAKNISKYDEPTPNPT